MEDIINKLAETEAAASHIMEDVSEQKKQLAQQYEEAVQKFDANIDMVYTIVNNKVDVIIANKIYTGWAKAVGGVIPKITSLIIPPPTAVVAPKIFTPKISIFFSIASMAPDEANATVPIISRTKVKISIRKVPLASMI